MKSFPFALHLVVVFIVGAHYHQIGTFCSSPKPPAHDRFNSSLNNAASTTTRTLLQHQQTTKIPRTIQRLVGGHLQHQRDRKLQDEKLNETQFSRIHFRRKPNQIRNTNNSRRNSTILQKVEPHTDELDDWNNDAALLEDPQDLDNWDNGIFRSSAGAGKESHLKGKKKDESKKTLADQVKEGKYGLIEKELFQHEPKRPGIISYQGNKEVPGDTSHNYGGLNEDDIWLAEDHLLVLKGGGLNEEDNNEPWEPIDDYEAPNRQIKIPENPKVPPPFPVQLEDSGPIQFIGDHKFPFFYPFTNESIPPFPGNGYLPTQTNGDHEKNLLTGSGPFKNATKGKGGYLYPVPYPPWLFNNQTFTNPFLNLGSPPSLLGPNGFLDNNTDYIDEDDPSLYYPPPYSFVYKSNYSNPVPPGPLVPGIILPPPPDAFARLQDHKSKTPSTEIPFKQILTKIAEYTPKTVVIPATTPRAPTLKTSVPLQKDVYYSVTRPTKPSRIHVYTTPQQNLIPTSQTPISHQSLPPTVTLRPVSVQRPIPPQTSQTPLSPQNILPQPEIINFVPKVPSDSNTLSKSNPIYYEYFDARKVPHDNAYYPEYTTTTPAPPKHHKNVQVTTIQPVQSPRVSKTYIPTRSYNFEDYVYITPRPEIRPNGIPSGYFPILIKPTYKPIQNAHNFEREVDAIRQTLQYYKTQQLHQNNYIPRAPKAKAVYEYSFDISKSNNINTSPQYDNEPFKPMVTYSRPIDDNNGFRAITYEKNGKSAAYQQQPEYRSTSATQERIRVGSKSYNQADVYSQTPRPIEFSTKAPKNYVQSQPNTQYTTSTPYLHNEPWISIEKQVVQEVLPQSTRKSTQKQRASTGYPRNVEQTSNQFNGYYYNPPITSRQNDRYYQLNNDESFSKHLASIKAQLNQYQPQLPISLENDTYINYALHRPPINPDAEFIQPIRGQQYQQIPRSQAQRSAPNRGQFEPISLSRDVLVNYRLPLPPINPDSEFIPPQIVNRNTQQYPSHQFRPPPPPPPPSSSDQSNLYYLTQRDLRYRKN